MLDDSPVMQELGLRLENKEPPVQVKQLLRISRLLRGYGTTMNTELLIINKKKKEDFIFTGVA
jgi:hypothetical protein